jgi:hypothetical protein
MQQTWRVELEPTIFQKSDANSDMLKGIGTKKFNDENRIDALPTGNAYCLFGVYVHEAFFFQSLTGRPSLVCRKGIYAVFLDVVFFLAPG